jgi:hypothetical protein
LLSSVERVRENWPNMFNRLTRPNTGALIFQRSTARRPSGVLLKRRNRIKRATAMSSSSHHHWPKKWLVPINIRVEAGNGTFIPSKIDIKRGSMNVMKKITMTTPTQATIAG